MRRDGSNLQSYGKKESPGGLSSILAAYFANAVYTRMPEDLASISQPKVLRDRPLLSRTKRGQDQPSRVETASYLYLLVFSVVIRRLMERLEARSAWIRDMLTMT